MRVILSGLIWLMLVSNAMAQESHSISAQKISLSSGKPNPAFYEMFEPLKWADVHSLCIQSGEVKVGKWFSYKAKEASVTITIRTGGSWGEIVAPKVYLGSNTLVKGKEQLTEIACAEVAGEELVVSINDLLPKTEYFILVTGAVAEKGQRFNIFLSDEYVSASDPRVKAEATAGTKPDYVMGRVRSKDGSPKEGVLISLLNSDKKPIESITSEADGTFVFEKLDPEIPVLSRIEEDDTELIVDLLLYDGDGNLKQRATRVGKNTYGFPDLPNAFKQLRLLQRADYALNVKAGMTGVAGRVVDAKTYLFGIRNVDIGLYNAQQQKLSATRTDNNGNFTFKDLMKGDYNVKIESASAGSYSEIVMVDDLNVPYAFANSNMMGADGFFKFEELPREIVEMRRMEERDTRMILPADFSNMEKGQAIVLKNILFETGSDDLKPSSYAELDRLADQLKAQTHVALEVSGHTDNQGAEQENYKLSEDRAKAVVDYLVLKGVDRSRLLAKGYGESKPIATNDTPEGREQNRRVEIQIME